MNESASERRDSFEGLYMSHFAEVVKAAHVLVGPEEALDVAQEAFARTWARWERLQKLDRPILYTLKAASNLAKTRLRRIKRMRDVVRRLAFRVERIETPSPDIHVALESAIRRLPLRQRQAIVLCDLADCSSQEAASILRIRASTMRVHLARARETLRTVLADPERQPPKSNRAIDERSAPDAEPKRGGERK